MKHAAHRTLLLLFTLPVAAQTPAPQPAAQPTPDELYQLGKQLFDQLAPAEIKEQFEFPSKEQWDAFAVRLQRALDGGSLEELAAYEAEARTALTALRLLPGYEDYADWLEQRIDEIQGAKQAAAPVPPPKPPAPGVKPPPAAPPPLLPHYDLWLARVRTRAVPAGAAALMPRLRAAFAAEGVPPELAWLAEAESSLNPAARSPAGAKGLFQLMPETARSLGLGTLLPDDRTDPEKSAHAARQIRQLAARPRRLQRRRRPRAPRAHRPRCEGFRRRGEFAAGGDAHVCPESLRARRRARRRAAGKNRGAPELSAGGRAYHPGSFA